MSEWKNKYNEWVHDKECAGCEKLFDCKGKPADDSVDKCVNFIERKRVGR